MKRSILRKVTKAAAVFLAAASLAGCSQKQVDPSLYATTAAAKFGEEEIYLTEPMFYAKEAQWYTEMIYGSSFTNAKELWDSNPESMAGIKEDAMASVLQTRILASNAEKYNVELTEEDNQKIETAVDEYMSSTDPAVLEAAATTREVALDIFTRNAIANKVWAVIVKDVDTNVDPEEARTARALYFTIPLEDTKEKAETILSRMEAGEDVNLMAEELGLTSEPGAFNNEDESVLGKAVMEMKTGEYRLVEDETGYYAVHCEAENHESSTQARIDSIIAGRQAEIFNVAYENLKAEAAEFTIIKEVWDAVKFDKAVYVPPTTAAETESNAEESTSADDTDPSESVDETTADDEETQESSAEN